MLNSLSSNAITAKCRAIYGNRLKDSDYHELLRQRSVSEIAAYLKNNTSYSQYLKGINELQVHRGQLENLINRSKYEKYFSLCNYDFSRKKGFYRYVISNVEVNSILHAIMLLNSNSAQNILADLPSFMREYASFDFLKLSTVKDFDMLLDILDCTPYKSVLKPFAAPVGQIDVSGCELALKTYYYKNVFDNINRFYKGKTKEELTELVSMEIELINISIIYRLTYYFKKSSDEIKKNLLPFKYKLNLNSIDSIANSKNTDQMFLEKVKISKHTSQMDDMSFNYIEDYTKRLKYLMNKRLIRFSSNAPIAFYALMALLQIEIDNITIIIEGIRYQHPINDIEKLLIL